MASDDESEPDICGAAPLNNALYLQLALTAGGNVLALCVIGIVWSCWLILADYRGALLWSVLSSIALRDLRDLLVEDATRRLEQTRSLPRILWQLAALPFATLGDTLQDLEWLWVKWRQSVSDYMQVYRRQVGGNPHDAAHHAVPFSIMEPSWANAELHGATLTVSYHTNRLGSVWCNSRPQSGPQRSRSRRQAAQTLLPAAARQQSATRPHP